MPSLHRAARGITLWEFLRLKVRQDSDRPNSTPRLALMISEFDALQQQLRTVVKDQLVPIAVETNTTHPDSKILVVSSLHCGRLALAYLSLNREVYVRPL